jgi:hypothetical protein
MPNSYLNQVENIRQAVILLNKLKTTTGCRDCGFNEWPESLHFDHIDPTTKQRSLGWVRDRSKLTSKTRLRRYLEHVSLYCEVRCANCHAHRTMVEQHWKARASVPIEHLTLF